MGFFTINTKVATECGLHAATILQWFMERHKKNKDQPWIAAGNGLLLSEMPWLSPTTSRTALQILIGAGLLDRRQRSERKGTAYEYAITEKADAYYQRR